MNKAEIPPLRCPICEGKDITAVSTHSDFPGSSIWFCSTCNYWFVNPEPDLLALNRYYRETYSQKRKRLFGEEYNVAMERRAKAQIRFLEENWRKSPTPVGISGLKIIDWGCGVGALVALLQNLGADVAGYDNDSAAVEIGQQRWGANIHSSPPGDLSPFRGKYDLLVMSHCLEHLPGLRETLENLLKFLKPGGYVFIEVPNSFAEMFVPRTDLESHLHFFSRRSLVLLLERLRVQVLSCVSCGPPRLMAAQPQQVSANPELGKRFFGKLMSLPRNMISRFWITNQQVRTIYDSYYENYFPDESGLWLRCLGRL